MSKTNQVCVCCEARYECAYYDTRRTVCEKWLNCEKVNSKDACALPQPTPIRLVEPVKTTTDWQQVRIQFIGAALTGLLANPDSILNRESIAEASIKIADALVAKLKKGGEE